MRMSESRNIINALVQHSSPLCRLKRELERVIIEPIDSCSLDNAVPSSGKIGEPLGSPMLCNRYEKLSWIPRRSL